ncbi:hypothetical protein [Rhodopila sp.]|uniref:hypothetical protein n=1 Tax=Rhodopila sp. TaxID=2480087 RepID=UPI003D14C99F
MRVNKSEIARLLGCSLPTVNAYLVRYGEDFPVLDRGGRGRDWRFDHEAVVAFLDGKRADEAAADADRQAALQQAMLPLGHNGGPPMDAEPSLRPAELLALMKVRRLQREEAYACGRLVEASKVQHALQDLLATWNRELHQALRRFGRERGLADDLVVDLTETLSGCQRRTVDYAQTVGVAGASQPSLFGNNAA